MNELESKIIELSAEQPQRAAIQFKDTEVGFGELLTRLRILQSDLSMSEGARVLVLLPDSLPGYLLHLALFLNKATIIPITPLCSSHYLDTVLRQVQPEQIVTNAPLYRKHQPLLEPFHCLLVGSSVTSTPTGLDYQWIGEGNDLGFAKQPEEVRVLLFTSGSTGTPRGVCLSEDNLLAAATNNIDFLSLSFPRRSLVTVPLYDYYGYLQIFSHILSGNCMVFGVSTAFVESLVRRLSAGDLTDLVLVPYTLKQLLQAPPDKAQTALTSVRHLASSSDLLSKDLLAKAFNLSPDIVIFNVYGLVEAGRSCCRKIMSGTPYKPSIGQPGQCVTITIDNPDVHGRGEIVIRGSTVMLGYLGGIQDNHIEFGPCKEVRSGDEAYADSDGDIILCGRSDHMINVMGSKIHPAEIESIALRYDTVEDVRARATTDINSNVTIYLDVVCSNGEQSLEGLQSHMRKHLHRFFVPKEINLVNSIQRTELGSKILRRDNSQ